MIRTVKQIRENVAYLRAENARLEKKNEELIERLRVAEEVMKVCDEFKEHLQEMNRIKNN